MQTPLLRLFSGWIVLSCLAALALPFPAVAAAKPEWVEKVKPEDVVYKYYVGRASDDDDAKSHREAYDDATEQALKENFGNLVEVSVQTYDNGSKVIPTRRVDSKMPKALIKDFEIDEQFREGNTLYVLYRYKKAAIDHEKARLAAGVPLEEEKNFTSSKGSLTQKGGLEIITTPDEINVTIDNEPWGKTPLRIERKLAPGIHTLRLDHPDYLTVYEQAIVNPNQITKIQKTLSRAKGTIRIDTTPVRDAQIYVDDNLIGSSPIDYQILAGIPVIVKATHAEAEEASTKASVTKDDIKPVILSLTLKPSTLSVYSEPSDAVVYLDGRDIGITPLVKKSAPAHRALDVIIVKEGYQRNVKSLVLKGGEDGVVNIELHKIPQIAIENKGSLNTSQKMGSNKDNVVINPWVMGGGFDISGSAFKEIDANLLGGYVFTEKRYGPVGLELRWTFFLGKSDSESTKHEDTITGNQFTVGLPIYPFKGKFFVKPEFGYLTGEADHYTDVNVQIKKHYDIGTTMYGLSIGFSPEKGTGFNVGFGMRKYNSTDDLGGDLDFTCFIGGAYAF